MLSGWETQSVGNRTPSLLLPYGWLYTNKEMDAGYQFDLVINQISIRLLGADRLRLILSKMVDATGFEPVTSRM